MIREEIKKHFAIIEAFRDGADIQYFNVVKNIWEDTDNPVFDINCEYRIRQEDGYIPFTRETFTLHRNKWFVEKANGLSKKVCGYSDASVRIDGVSVKYSDFLEDYTFEDGKPCGELIK